jgi:tetratricopeptide (TPR) repeat protein
VSVCVRMGSWDGHAGDVEAAVQHYTAAVRLVAAQWDESLPLDVAALYASRADAFARLGKHTRALADAEQAVEHRPTWIQAHLRRGVACYNLSHFHEAMEALSEVRRSWRFDRLDLHLLSPLPKQPSPRCCAINRQPTANLFRATGSAPQCLSAFGGTRIALGVRQTFVHPYPTSASTTERLWRRVWCWAETSAISRQARLHQGHRYRSC